MSCARPLVAVRTGIPNPNSIRILRRVDQATNLEEKYGRENVLFLPCGECEACRLKYRENWSIRCEMESMMHDKNCFMTLTYDDKHLLKDPSRRELRLFFMQLWKRKIDFTYFACGEKGTRTNRSHYHVALFGYVPDDLKYYGQSNGTSLFTSKFINDIWKRGNVLIGYFDKGAAYYIAGYVKKKEDSDNFLMMSKGLGFDFMRKNVDKLFKYQNYVGLNGKVHSLPRYFERICELNGYDLLQVKQKQKEVWFKQIDSELLQTNLSHNCQLFGRDAPIMKDKLHRLKRGL